MAQSVLTVTQANPTPPTNLIFVGNTPPLDPAQAVADDGIPMTTPNANSGTAANGATINEPAGVVYAQSSLITYAASTAAANTAGAPGAGVSNTHEAKSTETSTTATSANPSVIGQMKMVGDGPVNNTQAIRDAGPNANHASYLSGTTVPTITSPAPNNVASGAGNVATLTLTGTGYTRLSQIIVNGIRYPTTYISATSISCANVPKKATAGTLPIIVDNQGIQSAAGTWTFT